MEKTEESNKPSENKIQADIFQWYWNAFCLPQHEKEHGARGLIFHVPNENQHRNKKAIGVVSGVSDLIVVHEGITFFIEVKAEAGKQSPSQKKFEEHVEQAYTTRFRRYHIVRSLEEFKQLILTI